MPISGSFAGTRYLPNSEMAKGPNLIKISLSTRPLSSAPFLFLLPSLPNVSLSSHFQALDQVPGVLLKKKPEGL